MSRELVLPGHNATQATHPGLTVKIDIVKVVTDFDYQTLEEIWSRRVGIRRFRYMGREPAWPPGLATIGKQ